MLDTVFSREYDRQLPVFQDGPDIARKRSRIWEAPVILWSPEYEKNPEKFLDYIQDISNCLLLNGPTLYDENNPNHIGLFDVAKGKINPKEYRQFEYAFGDKGTTPIRDNHFFYSAKNHSISQIVEQPFRFACKNIDNEFSRKKIAKDASTTKKLLKTLFAHSMEQDGVNMGHMKDPSINLNGTPQQILDRLFGQEQLEMIVYKLLQNINYEQNIQNFAKKCFDNKLDVNAEFAYVKVQKGEVVMQPIHPNNVRWIAGSEIETLEDPSVIAASMIDYPTLNEVVNDHKHHMNTGTGVKGLLDTIDKLMEKSSSFYYNPEHKYFSETYRMNHLTSDPYDFDDDKSLRMVNVDYMKNLFYPIKRGPFSINRTILRQKMFFKIQRPARFLVEMNGKPTTEREFLKWRDGADSTGLRATFKQIGDDEKKPKGYVVDKFEEELWQATQLGHRTLIDVRPFEFNLKNKKGNNYIGMPIVAQISRNKSTVLVGENINRYCNILIQKVEEILQHAGLSSAMMIDESIISDTDALTTLYNAKKTGILMFNSSRMAGGTAFKGKHFEMLKMGHHLEEVERMMAAIGMFNEMYNRMVGSSEVAMGAGSNYDSTQKTKLNINNQSKLKADNYYEHNQFMNQVLQRMADYVKIVYATDDIKSVMLSTGERQILQLTKDLRLGDYDIYLESGEVSRNKKMIIDEAVMNALSSGGIDMFEPLIQILATDDPNTALGIFREARDVIKANEKALQEQQNQQAIALAQIQAQKIQVPIQVQGMKNDGALQQIAAKGEDQRERENFKGTMSDIEENNSRERQLMESEIRMDEETHRQAIQPQPTPTPAQQ